MLSHSFALRAVAGASLALVLASFGHAHATTKPSPTSKFGRIGSISTGSSIDSQAPLLTASDLVVNLAGVKSYDDLDAPINTVFTLSALPGAVVDGLTWSVSLSTVGDSWLSEATILITNSAGDGVVFSPGFGDDFTGSGNYADAVSLVALELSFPVLADGVLTMQFFEDFDDNPNAIDANYLGNNITFSGIGIAAVPEPSSYGLMALGLFGVVAAARRRKAA